MAGLLFNLWISSERIAAMIACCLGTGFMVWFLIAFLLESKEQVARQTSRPRNLETSPPSARVQFWMTQPKTDRRRVAHQAGHPASAIACDDGTWARGVAIPAHVFSLSEVRTVKKLRWEWR